MLIHQEIDCNDSRYLHAKCTYLYCMYNIPKPFSGQIAWNIIVKHEVMKMMSVHSCKTRAKKGQMDSASMCFVLLWIAVGHPLGKKNM